MTETLGGRSSFTSVFTQKILINFKTGLGFNQMLFSAINISRKYVKRIVWKLD